MLQMTLTGEGKGACQRGNREPAFGTRKHINGDQWGANASLFNVGAVGVKDQLEVWPKGEY